MVILSKSRKASAIVLAMIIALSILLPSWKAGTAYKKAVVEAAMHAHVVAQFPKAHAVAIACDQQTSAYGHISCTAVFFDEYLMQHQITAKCIPLFNEARAKCIIPTMHITT